MKKRQIYVSMLIIALVVALFSVNAVYVGADDTSNYTSASDVVYEAYTQDGIQIIANWGLRGEISKFLTVKADAFYTGDYTYDAMSELEGGSGQGDAYSSELYSELQKLMKSKHKHITGYQETRYQYRYTDCERGNIENISSFYSAKQISGTWDQGTTWNREHTWPRSKCIDTNKANDSADIMMLRPTSVNENSSRENDAYGMSSGFYEPADQVKGDCARIVLYGYTRWGNTSKMWGSNGVIENIDILLQWMEEDPVDTWEMGRNDSVESITGTRNVFVDYPEYAWLLFGEEIPCDMVTPSGEAMHKNNVTEEGTTGGSLDTETSGETNTANDENVTEETETEEKETCEVFDTDTDIAQSETGENESADSESEERDTDKSDGCGAVISGGTAIVLSISLAGIILSRKREE